MRGIVLTVFMYCFASFGQGIGWMNTYGNAGYDFGRDVKQDMDTGYVCTGSSSSFADPDAEAFLLKVDSLGNFMWSYNYGGEGTEWGESLVVTVDSNYALTGYSNSSGAGGFDFYFVKAGAFGVPTMEKTYGGPDWDKAYGLAELPDSGFVMVGETYSYGAGLKDAYMVRIDKFGDTLWTKTFGGSADDYFRAVIFDGDSIVAVGGTESFGAGMSDGLIMKVSVDGGVGWIDTVGMANDDYFTCIDYHGTYYMIGGANNYTPLTTKMDQWFYKVENDNSILHKDTSVATSVEDDELLDLMVQDVNEDIIVAGRTKSWGILDGYDDIMITKYFSAFWWADSQIYGGSGDDSPYAISETFDDGYIAIGDLGFNSTGGGNMFLLKNKPTWEVYDLATQMGSEIITTALPDAQNESLSIYPTLVEDKVKIDTPEELQSLYIFNLHGDVVFFDLSGDKQIDLTELNSGMYVMQLEVDGQLFSQKFVKK